MEISFVKKVRVENGQLKVFIPKDVERAIGLQPGEYIQITIKKVGGSNDRV